MNTDIIFLIVGNQRLGTGHIYRSIIYRKELTVIGFKCTTYYLPGDDLVKKIYEQYNMSAEQLDYLNSNIIKDSYSNVYILDILDTSKEFVCMLKEKNKVISFEDLGPGSEQADLVINALYKQKEIKANHYFGHNYVELREEFDNIFYEVKRKVKNVLITFGGTDPTNSTLLVVSSIYDYCISNSININIVNGPGYQYLNSLDSFPKINIRCNIDNMAKTMAQNDIAFCSAGRTIYELASIGVPSIVVTHNERENNHLFATQEYGFFNLGLGKFLEKKRVLKTYIKLVEDYQLRTHISNIMLENNLKEGKKRVLKLILKVINEK